jgi:hypothetical protein
MLILLQSYSHLLIVLLANVLVLGLGFNQSS